MIHRFSAPTIALVVGLPFLFLAACTTTPFSSSSFRRPSGDLAMGRDTHSYARPDQVEVRHMSFDWSVDFDRKRLSGTVTFALNRHDPSAPLRLDSKTLVIRSARAGSTGNLRDTTWQLHTGPTILGDELVVDLGPGDDTVTVDYETTDAGTGLQWLAPSQTASGRDPFLFTQSQAIHARTWFPCQDSPGVRITYDADVRVPSGLVAVMSAEQAESNKAAGRFSFRMPQAIPSYLIALSVGDLAFRSLGPRSGVWAEPSVLDRAASEFVDTESMITATEKLYGPYRWDRYDILVLPPSFPFGGMENPRLTFATPTILAGDRSLVALIAHELAHSWSGNLVTNSTWRDFWLNEGFTVYLEQRIMEAIFGSERMRMETRLGMEELKEEMAAMEPRDHVLHVDLDGRDPDDGFTGVPYEKGAAFLRRLEQVVGRSAFDDFLRGYFDHFAFRSITTEDFRAYLELHLVAKHPQVMGEVDIDRWIEGTGLPDDAPIPESDAFGRVEAHATKFLAGSASARDLPTRDWTTQEWLHFLRFFDDRDLSVERMTALDDAFGLTRTGNSEITCAWLLLAIRNDYGPANGRLQEFLTSQGRRKFLKPLYKELVKTPAGHARAREIYRIARPLYHAISVGTIDEIVGMPS